MFSSPITDAHSSITADQTPHQSPSDWLTDVSWTVGASVPGKPVPAPRPRVSRQGHAYYPASYTDWMERATALLQRNADPLAGPLAVGLDIVGERPGKTKLLTPKGDVDNFAKSTLDALTKARAWLDDDQVHCLIVRKRWSDTDTPAGVQVFIAELNNQPEPMTLERMLDGYVRPEPGDQT